MPSPSRPSSGLRQVILHIGRHKSGTSSLQHHLGAARDRLGAQGVLYPRAGSDNRIAHHALALQCNPRQTDGAGLDGIATAILAELEPHHDRILLSSEAFQNIADTDRLRGFLDRLGAPEIRVICYVREHLDYAISGFRQLVQNQDRFVTFARHAAGLGNMAGFLRRWDSLGDLALKWYDRAELRDGDVIADFCDQAGIDPGPIRPGDMNPSIGGNLLVYKLAANHLGLPAPGYAALRDLAGAEPRFRAPFHVSDAAAEALRADSAYNATLIRRLGPVRMKSWDRHAALPETDSLDDDLARILSGTAADDLARLRAVMAGSAAWFDLGAEAA